MPVLLKDGAAVLFVHVPKTGGTSIERFFVRNGWEMHYRDGAASEGSLNSYLKCSPQHLEARRLSQFFRLDRFDFTFSVVREPIARFRSEYSMRNARNLRTNSETVDGWSESAFRAYHEDQYVFDNHLRPQRDFLLPDSLVYRLEGGLQKVVDDLNERFALDLSGDVPRESDRALETGVSSNAVQISPRLERRLRQFYAVDFEEFGY